MRNIVSTLLCLTLFTLSCKKTNSAFLIPDGIYTGTFQRQSATGGQISNVAITFSANHWTGQSEFDKYPALCHGTCYAKGIDSVVFENACPWTAEFDWTLILSEAYKIEVAGRDIEISRDYNGLYKDIYKLTKH